MYVVPSHALFNWRQLHVITVDILQICMCINDTHEVVAFKLNTLVLFINWAWKYALIKIKEEVSGHWRLLECMTKKQIINSLCCHLAFSN